MQDTEYLVTYACGSDNNHHTRVVSFPGSMSPEAVEEMLRVLSRSWCPACHRQQRQQQARRYSRRLGLLPLSGSDADQLGLAEEVRARLLQDFISSQTKLQALATLISLVNRCLDPDFWIEHRMILWDRQLVGEMVADLQARAVAAL